MRRPRCRPWRCICLCLIALASGCGPTSPVPTSDVDSAKIVMRQCLESWQQGSSVADMRQQTPPIYVADEQWERGTKLDGFEIESNGELYGTNVRFQVRLNSVDTQGRKTERSASYLVTTVPAITIAREDK